MESLKYSLVVPVYKNEGSILALLDVLESMSSLLVGNLEVVFVIDGSPDSSYRLLREKLAAHSFDSQLLLHSRNFGSFAAIRTGLEAARGEFFAVMAADLQEPPELIVNIFECLALNEADIVVGTRETREDSALSRFTSGLFWSFYRRFIMPEMPVGGVDIFGCNMLFRDQLMLLEELHSSLIGQIFWLGFRRKLIPYQRTARVHCVSGWTLKKKLNYLMDSIFSFSDMPINILIVAGLVGLGFSFSFGFIVLLTSILSSIPVPGYAATVIMVLFFGGLNSFGLGVIGAYVWRAYANTQNRPLAIVMNSEKFEPKSGKDKE
jgi:glycosyltransferase involved in cell wall biosynthesis